MPLLNHIRAQNVPMYHTFIALLRNAPIKDKKYNFSVYPDNTAFATDEEPSAAASARLLLLLLLSLPLLPPPSPPGDRMTFSDFSGQSVGSKSQIKQHAEKLDLKKKKKKIASVKGAACRKGEEKIVSK